jgi:hypothetical protein
MMSSGGFSPFSRLWNCRGPSDKNQRAGKVSYAAKLG